MSVSTTTRRWRFPLGLLLLFGVAGAIWAVVIFKPEWLARLEAPEWVDQLTLPAWLGGENSKAKTQAMDRTVAVKRGGFPITIELEGNLGAIKNYDIWCPVQRREKRIIHVVQDRARVKEGDIVAKLAPDEHVAELERLQLKLSESERDLALAQEDLRILRSTNFSNIKTAVDSVRSKKDALKKYLELELEYKRKELKDAIDAGEEKLDAARDALAVAEEELLAVDADDEEKLEELEEAKEKAENEVEKARKELKEASHAFRVWRQYDHPQKLRSLRNELARAQLEQEKVVVSANSQEVQAQRKIQSHRTRIEQLSKDIKTVEEDIAKLEIRAPVDGIVSLGNPHRRRWQDPKEIEIGTTLRFREYFATIPDLSRFMIRVNLPEEFRSRVKVGTPARSTSPAIPDLVLKGEVTKIPVMSQRTIHWDPSSPKIYEIEISTGSTHPRMMPGMSVDVELIIGEVRDALYVPVEAVYNREGETYCLVESGKEPEERKVETGLASTSYVEILGGLEEGHQVLVYRPAG